MGTGEEGCQTTESLDRFRAWRAKFALVTAFACEIQRGRWAAAAVRGSQQALSLKAVAAILEALKAGRVNFLPPPGPPPTPLELMLHGDRWKRAGEAADRRLARPRRHRR
jgi:hypothetical protein